MPSIDELVESSRQVIQECQVENGAIVAANTDKEYYPEDVANYRFVWPRDAAYTIYAEKLLGMDRMEEEFIEWLHDRAEGFKESGLVFHRYATNGARDTDFGHQYQPDQAAALLWAILDTNSELNEKQSETVHLLADGLWDQWREHSFVQDTHDLWEERTAYHDKKENFTYTLAACSKALFLGAERMDEKKWEKTAREMQSELIDHYSEEKQYFLRSCGEVCDDSIDSSVLGIIWPFDVIEKDHRIDSTLEKMEEELMTDRGLMRYRGDMYDGVLHHTGYLSKGAGAWPLLSFWYVKVLSMLGRKEKAEELFHDQINQLEGRYIPEQLFDDQRRGIRPLAWSHAMFVVAAEELGYLE
ncbi:MAG: glycoside hydrolase family 15 protein [Candidatus Nanohaloarchaea archaeon]